MKAMSVWSGGFEVGGQHYPISDSRLFVHEAFLKEEESERNQKGAEKESKKEPKKEPKESWIYSRNWKKIQR